MKVLVLGATGGTGRLIVRDAVAKGHSVVALVSLDGARRSAGSRHDRGRCSRRGRPYARLGGRLVDQAATLVLGGALIRQGWINV